MNSNTSNKPKLFGRKIDWTEKPHRLYRKVFLSILKQPLPLRFTESGCDINYYDDQGCFVANSTQLDDALDEHQLWEGSMFYDEPSDFGYDPYAYQPFEGLEDLDLGDEEPVDE